MSSMYEAQAAATINAAVVAKAVTEPEFRSQLIADPKGTVEKMLGASLPAGLTLKVVEATPSEYTIVLPYQPAGVADGELSDADLEAVAGGSKAGAKKFFREFAAGASTATLGLGSGIGRAFDPEAEQACDDAYHKILGR